MTDEVVIEQANDITAEVIGGSEDGRRVDYIMKIDGKEVEVTRQLMDDQFNYDQYECIAPPYNFDALEYFFETNTWHARSCRLKSACTVGLGYVFQLIKNKQEDIKEKEKLEEFFKNCNPEETFGEILEKFMLDYEYLGNAYLEIIRNLSGEIVRIYHIPAATIRVRKDQDGYVQMRDTRYVFFKKFGDLSKYNIHGKIESDTLVNKLATELIHFFQYSPKSTYYGVPEWLAASAAMLGTEKANDYNIQFFDNNAVPQFAVIVHKASLGRPVKDTIAQYFRQEIKGKSHKTLVLEVPGEGELELKELATDPKEQSFRFYRLDNRDEVIAAHGVPPRMVGIISPGSMGGKGDPEGQKEAFLSQIIRPLQSRLNHRINKLLIGNGIGALNYEFVLESLNPNNDNDDSERHDRLLKIGVLTIQEVRDAMRLPRYENNPGADQPFIFTSSGPILVSMLEEYMKAALMPTQPKPPGLPGSPGVSTNSSSPTRKSIEQMIEDFDKIQKELKIELAKIGGQLDG